MDNIRRNIFNPKVFCAILAVISFVTWAITGEDIDPEVIDRAKSTYNAITAVSE